ncbi:hypothetical protein TELCIR_15482, partial [Teladorsagia circumcincta]
SSKELSWQRERLSLKDEIARLQLAAEEHEGQLQLKKKHADEALERITQLSAEHSVAIADLEAELRKERELSNLYKESLEKAEHVAAELRLGSCSESFLVYFVQLIQMMEEIEEEKRMRNVEVAMKGQQEDLYIFVLSCYLCTSTELCQSIVFVSDEQLSELREELLKANELLKSKHADRAPQLFHQKDLLDKTFDHNNRLQEQLKPLPNQAQLIHYCDKKRYNSLIHENGSFVTVFSRLKLAFFSKEADEARRRLESARDSTTRELAFTRAELEKYQRDYANASKQLQSQTEQLKKLAEDNVSVVEARTAKIKAEEAAAKAQASEVKVARLEEYIRAIKEEKEISERVHSDRVARSEQIVSEVKMTNARLEASFEMQKQTTAVVEKELERARKETDQIREENDRLRAGDAQMASRVEQLHQELMGLQTQTSNYKIELRAVTEELQHARMTINRLETEAEARKRTSFSEQQMMLSLNEMTTRLSRVESEKTAHLGSQLDEDSFKVIRLERDSLKTSNARLTDQLSNSRNDAKQAQAQASEVKVARLEEYIRAIKEEKEISERVHSDRVARSEQIVSEVKMTNARLEASFEMQKQTTAVVEKELERARKETDQIREENDRLRAGDAQMASRVEQLHQELMGLQTQTSNYKIELRAVTEELQHARMTINRLETEAEARKRTSFSEQQMARYEEEISLLRQQLTEKEKELALCERQLIDSRARLSNIQAQYTAQESTVGMTPERLQKECQQLKNRSQYLECQLDELKSKLAEAENTALKKSSENDRMESHSKVMETNLKQMAELGSMERERLEARAASAEARSEELTSRVAELSNKIVQLENEMSDIKMDQLQQSSQLQLKIDILEAQIKDADNSVAELNVSLNAARVEIDKRVSEGNELSDQLNELKCTLADRDEEIMMKNSKLESKEMELFNANERVRVAEENLRATETTLAARLEEMSAAEVKYNEGIKEYEMKLEQLLEKYENVVAQMTETSSSMEMKDVTDISMNAETSVIESMKSVVAFLREEKQKAISRSMTAEVEVKRLRAEVAEIRSNRDELAATVQSLQSEAMANANALAEKAQLKRELETKLEGLVASSNEASSKITMLSSELTAKKKEADLLRQRAAEAALKGDQEIKAELDQCRSKLTRVEAELNKANTQAVEAEKLKMAAEYAYINY